MAYKNTRTRTIIFIFFVLCNVFMPFNIMEIYYLGYNVRGDFFIHARSRSCSAGCIDLFFRILLEYVEQYKVVNEWFDDEINALLKEYNLE